MKKKREAYYDIRGLMKSEFNENRVKFDMTFVLNVYDRFMDKDAAFWNKMKEARRQETSLAIMKETEETAWTIGCLLEETSMTKENLAVEAFDLHKEESAPVDIQVALSMAEIGSVRLPGGLQPKTSNACLKSAQRGIVAAYKNTGYLNPQGSHTRAISSGIIGVSVDRSSSTYHLPKNQLVRIVLHHLPQAKGVEVHCVFLNWDTAGSNGDYGVWDTAGCHVNRSEKNYTVCDCNHLTNFAILMDFTNAQFSPTDDNILSIISKICCSLSSVALMLTIIIYLTVKSLRSRRSTITCNLAACLLAMNLLVQTGLERVSTTMCKIISAVLQYCVLSAFFWMLLEGALLYKMVIVVFETKKLSLKILYSIAYGVPFFIVTLTSAVNNKTMIREKYCWPSTEKGHIWSIIGPIVLVITVNLIILCLTLNAALKMDKMSATATNFSPKDRKKIVKQRLKGMFSLVCLLGFTWTVGFFIVPQTPAAAYIFVIVNGLQGVFLFVTQLILNENARRKLFAIYKENFSRLSSVTSSWHIASISKPKSKNLPKMPMQEKKPRKEDEFSTICLDEDQKIQDLPSLQGSHLQLCKIRLKIIELEKEPIDIHPFELNHGFV